jgi:hypothetical protein
MPALREWEKRHLDALSRPAPGAEDSIVRMMVAIESYVDVAMDGKSDGYLSPCVGEMLSGFIGLLSGSTGRLDAGRLDEWARRIADKIGWDLDRACMAH